MPGGLLEAHVCLALPCTRLLPACLPLIAPPRLTARCCCCSAGNVSSCLEVGIRRAVSWVMDHLHLLPNHGVTDFQPSELQVVPPDTATASSHQPLIWQ